MQQSPTAKSQGFKDPFSGLSHAFGFVAALVCLPLMVGAARAELGSIATIIVYGLSLLTLYAASSSYHLVNASGQRAVRLRQFDHCAIFVFIAGTCTPLFFHAFDGVRRVVMLSIVWAVAVAGIATRLLWAGAPRWLYTAKYVAMGWIVVFQIKAFWAGVSREVLLLTVAGGLVYTAGAVVYATKRPDWYPGRFGFHELWHMFVLVASGLHMAAVYVLTRK